MRHALPLTCAAAGAGFAANMLDLFLSWGAVAAGVAEEKNLLLAASMGVEPLWFMVAVFTVVHAIVWSLVLLVSRDHPRTALALSFGIAGTYAAVMLRDISVLLSCF